MICCSPNSIMFLGWHWVGRPSNTVLCTYLFTSELIPANPMPQIGRPPLPSHYRPASSSPSAMSWRSTTPQPACVAGILVVVSGRRTTPAQRAGRLVGGTDSHDGWVAMLQDHEGGG